MVPYHGEDVYPAPFVHFECVSESDIGDSSHDTCKTIIIAGGVIVTSPIYSSRQSIEWPG